MKSWFNKGDKFIKKYEGLKQIKEERDRLVKQKNKVSPANIEGILLSTSLWNSEQLKIHRYEVRNEISDIIMSYYQDKIDVLNEKMKKKTEKICECNES